MSLFKTKTGKHNEEEFDMARQAFPADCTPLIHAYFMRGNIPNDKRHRKDLNSRWDFQDKLSELGHCHTEYSSIENLQLQLRRQLEKLMDSGKI